MIQIDKKRFESVIDQWEKNGSLYIRTRISDTYNLTDEDIETIKNAKRLSIISIMRFGMTDNYVEKELWIFELLENTRCEHSDMDMGYIFTWRATVIG